MTNRKSIGKKLRFEVFKRDAFTCQYCGKKAPDVILHVDHISPVSKGGDNDILNLITSCSDCNLGKGAREITDHSELERQRQQLEELNERREQLEAMLQWRDELRGFDETVLESVVEVWNEAIYPFSVNEVGRASLQKLVKKFGHEIVVAAIDTSVERYVKFDADGPTRDSVEAAFNKLGGICYFSANPERSRDDRDIYYVRGILRNRLSYVNDGMCIKLLREARDLNLDLDTAKELAKTVNSWTEFRDLLTEFIEERRDG